MSKIEMAALIILTISAAALVVLAVHWDQQDRKPLDPPLVMPEPAYRPKHADWGPTTLLRRPRGETRD